MFLHRYLWVLFAYLIMAPAEASEKEENFGMQDMKRGELFLEWGGGGAMCIRMEK